MDSATSAPALAQSTAWRGRADAALRLVVARTGLPASYLVCAPLALLAIWGHRYPPGVDLPEHAELLRLWMDVVRRVPDVVNLYELQPLTPYTLAYLIGHPVALLFGARAGIKLVLTVAALGTPWMMTRWLRVVGGDERMGVVGFPVVFGWAFLWGFLSHCVGLVFLFGYLVAFERQAQDGVHVTLRRGLSTVGWGVALFFCHGVTFGVAMMIAGMRLLIRPRPRLMWRSWLQFIPLGALTLYWMSLQARAVSDPTGEWWMNWSRLRILFSSLFCVQVNGRWAGIVAGVLVLWGLFVLPQINWRPAAWVPFVTVALLFIVLPGHIVSTELVGPRFCVYVQAFAPGVFLARPGRWDRHFAWTPLVLVVVCLVALNVRIYKYNVEMDAFRAVAARAEPGADIQTFQPNLLGSSDVFGFRGVAVAAAWLAAENGGILADDYAARFNMPVQRKQVSFPSRYRYIFTFAKDEEVMDNFPDAKLVARSGPWSLYERAPQFAGKFRVIRSGQGWGPLVVDGSVVETPLSIAGVPFEHGLGTHANSWIELRAPPGTRRIEGGCGLDDSGEEDALITCSIRNLDGRQRWTSPPLMRGQLPAPFTVTFPRDGVLILEVFSVLVNKGTHADWVDLR